MSSISKAEGHDSKLPTKLSWQEWKAIGWRVKDQLANDHVQVVAAGVAFYFFLALFPALAAAVSLYGLIVDAQQVQQQMSGLASVLPDPAQILLTDFLEGLVSKSSASLGLGLVVSILLSLYSAKKGVSALIEGLNIVYNVSEERGFLKKTALQLLFTLGAIGAGLLALALVVGWPAMVGRMGLLPIATMVIGWGRWLMLALILIFSLEIVYRYGPDRENPKMKWISWGASLATLLWMLASMLFSWYINGFGNYDKTYGSLAAIIILLLWLLLTAYIILLGGEVDAEIDRLRTQAGDPEADSAAVSHGPEFFENQAAASDMDEEL